MIKTVTATRYITPLREGGSLPAIVEADDDQLYVMKFIGAGQGAKALVAELLAGEIGRTLGLRVPEIVLIKLDPMLGRSEPNPEIQDLLRASAGRLNLGLRYLPNAFDYNMFTQPAPDRKLASKIVWFDAYVTNVDRTDRNVNLLLWHDELWLIDHGAALYFHHSWDDFITRSRSAFSPIKDHTLLRFAKDIDLANTTLRPLLNADVLSHLIHQIPAEWLDNEPIFANVEEHRAGYLTYLQNRLDASEAFVEEAIHARRQFV
jgi:hypothetical protein